MALSVTDVVSLILQYIGGKPVGPVRGINAGIMPVISQDLFGGLSSAFGQLLPNVSSLVTSQIQEFASGLGLDPNNLSGALMKNPVADAYEEGVAKLSDAISTVNSNAVLGQLLITDDLTVLQDQITNLNDLSGQISGNLPHVDPSAMPASRLVTELASNPNLDVAAVTTATSSYWTNGNALITAANADIAAITSKLTVANLTDAAKVTIGRELQAKATEYTTAITSHIDTYKASIAAVVDTPAKKLANVALPSMTAVLSTQSILPPDAATLFSQHLTPVAEFAQQKINEATSVSSNLQQSAKKALDQAVLDNKPTLV